MLFEVKEVDKAFYREQIADFLPDKIVDIHTHVWLDRMIKHRDDELASVASWPFKVAKDNSIEDLIETYRLVFPGKEVLPLIFSNVLDKNNLRQLNQYCGNCSAEYNYPALAVVRPDWDADEFEAVIKEGHFLGAKVYLTFADKNIPADKIEIFDFLPHHQLEVLDKNGWLVILHIARPGRLKDPVNLAQLLEIERRYPNVTLIVAHVGRAYCLEDVGNAFAVLKDTQKMYFDISANTNADVFKMLIDAVGPKRVLFGSDMPITRMRMRRICENGRYINIVPKGLYGDVSDDKNMREVDGQEADKLSFFIYEQIAAFKKAAIDCRLSDSDIENVFNKNAGMLLSHIC